MRDTRSADVQKAEDKWRGQQVDRGRLTTVVSTGRLVRPTDDDQIISKTQQCTCEMCPTSVTWIVYLLANGRSKRQWSLEHSVGDTKYCTVSGENFRKNLSKWTQKLTPPP